MRMKCSFCEGDNEFAAYEIKRFNFWHVNLHTSQYYLGRSAIILNRHLEDFFDITDEERDELFIITKQLRDGLKQTFAADMFNYATLGNVVRHVHLHVIPRYAKSIEFGGQIFKDENWGENYAPYNKNFTIPAELYTQIKNKILTIF